MKHVRIVHPSLRKPQGRDLHSAAVCESLGDTCHRPLCPRCRSENYALFASKHAADTVQIVRAVS